jgi:hypothetical protein
MARARVGAGPDLVAGHVSDEDLTRRARFALAELRLQAPTNPRRLCLARRLVRAHYEAIVQLRRDEWSWATIRSHLAGCERVSAAALRAALAKERFARKRANP